MLTNYISLLQAMVCRVAKKWFIGIIKLVFAKI